MTSEASPASKAGQNLSIIKNTISRNWFDVRYFPHASNAGRLLLSNTHSAYVIKPISKLNMTTDSTVDREPVQYPVLSASLANQRCTAVSPVRAIGHQNRRGSASR